MASIRSSLASEPALCLRRLYLSRQCADCFSISRTHTGGNSSSSRNRCRRRSPVVEVSAAEPCTVHSHQCAAVSRCFREVEWRRDSRFHRAQTRSLEQSTLIAALGLGAILPLSLVSIARRAANRRDVVSRFPFRYLLTHPTALVKSFKNIPGGRESRQPTPDSDENRVDGDLPLGSHPPSLASRVPESSERAHLSEAFHLPEHWALSASRMSILRGSRQEAKDERGDGSQ